MLRRKLNSVFQSAQSKLRSNSSPIDHSVATNNKTWGRFCDKTSIHGLHYIGGTNPPKKIKWRILWGIIWISMFGICVWLCMKIVNTYLQANVVTSSTFVWQKELEFPSITICSENIFKKSKVGNSWQLMKIMATFSSLSENQEDIEKLAMENWKYCNNSQEIAQDDETLWEKGYVQGMRKIATDSFSSVHSAIYQAEGFKTGKNNPFFLNHVCDHHGMCFTINPGKDYLRSMTNESYQNFGYGLLLTNFSYKIKAAGFDTGFRVLLNTEHEEYCGVQNKYRGVGFKAIIHHPEDPPWFLMQKSLQLDPSNAHYVVMSVTKIERRTSHLGRCIDNLDLHLTPNTSQYFKNQCYQQCFVEQVYRKCKCFPQFYYRNQDRYSPIYIDGEVMNITKYCWNDTMPCMNRAKKFYVDNNPDKACPSCKEACIETQYNYVMSSFLYPPEQSVSFLSNTYNVSEEKLRKDFLFVNFMFNSMQLTQETESQHFTLVDLCIYFGSMIGLFLGASIMSFGEVFQQIFVATKPYLLCKRRRMKMHVR